MFEDLYEYDLNTFFLAEYKKEDKKEDKNFYDRD